MAEVPKFAAYRWNQHMNRSLEEALSEVERELHIRIKCFDNWYAQGKFSWVDGNDRLERMLSAVKHLRDYQTLLKVSELQNLTPGQPPADQDLPNTIPFTPAQSATAPEGASERQARQNSA